MLKQLFTERVIPILTVSGLLYLFIMIANMVPVNFMSRQLIIKFRDAGISVFANDNVYYSLHKLMYATNNVSIYNIKDFTGKIGDKDAQLDFLIYKQGVKLDVKNVKWSSNLEKLEFNEGVIQLNQVQSKDLLFFLASLLKQTKVNKRLLLNLKEIKIIARQDDKEEVLLDIHELDIEKYFGYVKIKGEIEIDKQKFDVDAIYEDVISESSYEVKFESLKNLLVVKGSIKDDGLHMGNINGDVNSLALFNEFLPNSLKSKIEIDVFEDRTKLRGSYKLVKQNYNLFMNCKQEDAEFSLSVNKNKASVAIININFESGRFNVAAKNSEEKDDSIIDVKTLFKMYFSNLEVKVNCFFNNVRFGDVNVNSSKLVFWIDKLKKIRYEDSQFKIGSTDIFLKSPKEQSIHSFEYKFSPESTKTFVAENLKGVKKISDIVEFGIRNTTSLSFFLDVKRDNGQSLIFQSIDILQDSTIKFFNRFESIDLSENYIFKGLQEGIRRHFIHLMRSREQSSVHYELLKTQLLPLTSVFVAENCSYQNISINKLSFNYSTKPNSFNVDAFNMHAGMSEKFSGSLNLFFNSVTVNGTLDIKIQNAQIATLATVFNVQDLLAFNRSFAVPSMLAVNGNVNIEGENVKFFNSPVANFNIFGQMVNGIFTLNNESRYDITGSLKQKLSGIVDLRAKPVFDIGLAGLLKVHEWLKSRCKFANLKQFELLFLCRFKTEGFGMKQIVDNADARCNLSKGFFILDFDNLYQVAKNLRLGIVEFDPVEILKDKRYTDFSIGGASVILKNNVLTATNIPMGSSLLPFKFNASYNFLNKKAAIRGSSALFALNYKLPTEFMQIPLSYEADIDLNSCTVIDVFKLDEVNAYIDAAKKYTTEVRK